MRRLCRTLWRRCAGALLQQADLNYLPGTDDVQGGKRQGVHDAGNESDLQHRDARFCKDQVSLQRCFVLGGRLTGIRSLNTANDEDGLQEKDRTFDDEDLRRSFESIEAVNFLEEVSVLSTANSSTSIRFTSYHAGHVLGAAMFLIEIAGARILYTGDYSVEEDRHLITASLPNWGRPPDVMICESTFGRGNLPPRQQQEADLLANVANILKRGGRVLMPETAIGRVQELLLILDEHWSKRQDLQQYPIYFVGGNGTRGMAVYRQHSNSLNASIQARVARGDNPFDFRKNGFVREVRGINKKDRFDDSKPCVVIASPGMLQYGVSRELLEKWAPDSKNGLILCGYSIEGTLARVSGAC